MTSTIETTDRLSIEVGTKLRFIDESGMGASLSSKGEIVTVMRVDDDDDLLEGQDYRLLLVEKKGGRQYTSHAYRFEAVETFGPVYEVGQRVEAREYRDGDFKPGTVVGFWIWGSSKTEVDGEDRDAIRVTLDGEYDPGAYDRENVRPLIEVDDEEPLARAYVLAEDGTTSEVWWDHLEEYVEPSKPEPQPQLPVGTRVLVHDASFLFENEARSGTVVYTDWVQEGRLLVELDEKWSPYGGATIRADRWSVETPLPEPLGRDDLRVGDRVVSILSQVMEESYNWTGGHKHLSGIGTVVSVDDPYIEVAIDHSGSQALLRLEELDLATLHEPEEPFELAVGDRVRVREGGREYSKRNAGQVFTVKNVHPAGYLTTEPNGEPSFYLSDVEKFEGFLPGDRVTYTGNDVDEFYEPDVIGNTGTVVETYYNDDIITTTVEWDEAPADRRLPASNVFSVNLSLGGEKAEERPEVEVYPTIESLEGLAAVTTEGTVLRSTTTGSVYVRTDGRWKQVGDTGDATWTIAQTVVIGKPFQVLYTA